eukprot:1033186-Amorphochlora_amoeboformis.AAC.2
MAPRMAMNGTQADVLDVTSAGQVHKNEGRRRQSWGPCLGSPRHKSQDPPNYAGQGGCPHSLRDSGRLFTTLESLDNQQPTIGQVSVIFLLLVHTHLASTASSEPSSLGKFGTKLVVVASRVHNRFAHLIVGVECGTNK